MACNVRMGRTHIAEMAAEQDAATTSLSWANLMKDLPPGLEDRLLAAETFLQQSFKVGAGVDISAIDALRRAREAHGKIASQTQPLAAAFMMTWGVLLAIALDTVLQLFLAAQTPPALASNECQQPVITSDKSCLSQARSGMNVLSDRRHFESQHAEQQEAFASQRARDGDWDRLSEVGYDPEAETREQTAAEQHSDLEGVLDETRGRRWHDAAAPAVPAAKYSTGNVSVQELKEGMSLNAQSLPLDSTRRDHLLTSNTESWLQDTKHDATCCKVDSPFVFLIESNNVWWSFLISSLKQEKTTHKPESNQKLSMFCVRSSFISFYV